MGRMNIYIVRKTYNRLVSASGEKKKDEVFKKLSKSKVLRSSRVCEWRVMHNRVSIHDKLRKIGIPIENIIFLYPILARKVRATYSLYAWKLVKYDKFETNGLMCNKITCYVFNWRVLVGKQTICGA